MFSGLKIQAMLPAKQTKKMSSFEKNISVLHLNAWRYNNTFLRLKFQRKFYSNM